MKTTQRLWRLKLISVLILMNTVLFAAGSPSASYLKSGLNAYQGRRWIESMDCFLRVLSEDPKNEQAHLYLTKIAEQIDNERIAMVNEARMDMLSRTAQRLDVARMETKPVDQAIDDNRKREARQKAEDQHQSCILARKEQTLGHLENANDLVLGVLREDPNNAEAQVILSDLQSGIHESLSTQHDLTTAQQLSLQGFYAYGQADYRSALASWKQVRTELSKSVPPDEVDHQLSLFHFDQYQKLSQAYVDKEGSKTRDQSLFEQGVDLFEQGNMSGALNNFRQIALNDPEFPQLAKYLSDSQASVERARTHDLSLAQQDRSAQYFAQGLDFLDGDKPADAKKAFAEVLKVDRAHPQAKSYYALCQALLDHRRDPAASKQYYETGLIAYAAGKPEEAVREWQGAKRLDTGNLKAVIALTKVKKEIAQSEDIGL